MSKLAMSLVAFATLSAQAQLPVLTAGRVGGDQISLSWPVTGQAFALEQSPRMGAGAAWSPVNGLPAVSEGTNTVVVPATGAEQYFQLRGVTAPTLTTIVNTSPSAGEAGVSVNREAIVEFSEPLAADALVSTEAFHANFGGRRLLSRAELASDRRRATLFFLEPLPGGARVEVTLAGDGLLDAHGQRLDADGDGTPGGTAQFAFETMSTAGLAGTAVTGRVLASEPVAIAGGFTNLPLEGVLISVDGAEQQLWTRTDTNGVFRLDPSPTGRFFVHIDGRTASGSAWPSGDYYPVVGKTFEAVAGRTNNLAGGTGEIFLPLVKAGTLQPVSATQPTTITFPAAVLAGNPALAGTRLTVPANALFADNGARGGSVGLAPVAPDRIPSPLPAGLALPLVFTIQTDGPSNFDQPVAVRFPNLPDPVTGQVLPAGAKSALWSYNHDTGRWEIQGSMTVSADGLFVESDPGVGIRQPGWHGSSAGSSGGGGGGGSPGPCSAEQQAVQDALFGCAFGAALELAELAPAIGCGISLASSAASAVSDCSDPTKSCGGSIAFNGLFGVAGCIPGVGTFAGLLQCGITLGDAVGSLAACQSLNPSSAQRANVRIAGDDDLELQEQLLGAGVSLVEAIYGDQVWLEAASADPVNTAAFGNAFVAALNPASEDAARISSSERSILLALPAPNGLSPATVSALLDRFDRIAQGGMTAAEKAAIEAAAARLIAAAEAAEDAGWTGMFDGILAQLEEITNTNDSGFRGGGSAGAAASPQVARQAAAAPGDYGPLVGRELLYHLADLSTGFVRRGRTSPNGQLDNLIMGVNTPYLLTYLDPVTQQLGTVHFRSGNAGERFTLPIAQLVSAGGSDADLDGLSDYAEEIVGTSPTDADTDDDGATDLMEVQLGLNPLDGLALPQAAVANLPLGGSTTGFSRDAVALGLHVDGNRVFVANGRRGLAVVNATDPLRPVWEGELDLPGESFDVSHSPEAQVAALVATPEETIPGERGLLHLVDVSNPAAPRLLLSYTLPGVAVEAWNGRFFVALGNFAAKEVRSYDAASGLELGSFTTQDFPTGLRVTGGLAYVATWTALEIFDVTPPQPVRLGRLIGDFTPEILGRVHLVLDGTTLYVSKTHGVATVDVTDPAAPSFIGVPPNTTGAVRSLALSGGPRMAALTLGTPTGNSSATPTVSIYDASNPANTTTFLFGVVAPGRPRDLAMLGGFALVADDSRGLTVVNFADPDLAGAGPAVTFDATKLDTDPGTPGVQVPAGATLDLTPRVRDDVHLTRVELLVDGTLVASQTTYPVSFRLGVPTDPGASVNLRFRATDGSGNTADSAPLTLGVVADTVPPTLLSSLPAASGAGYLRHPLVLQFSEPVDALPVDLAKVRCVSLGADAAPGGGDDGAIVLAGATARESVLTLNLPAGISAGRFQLSLETGAVRDRSGNALAATATIAFDLVDAAPGTALWIADADGNWNTPANWLHGRVPAQDDEVLLQRFGAQPVVTVNAAALAKRVKTATPLRLANRGSLTVLRDFDARARVEVPAGDLGLQGPATFAEALSLTGGSVTANGRLETRGMLTLNGGGTLTLEGAGAEFVPSGPVEGAHFTFRVTGGAIATLPGLAQLEVPGDFTPLFPLGTTLSARGAGSRLNLSDLAAANGPVNWNVRGIPTLRFEATEGGALILPRLATLTGRTALVAADPDSRLEAPLLTAVAGPTSEFIASLGATGGGTLQVPALASLTRVTFTLGELIGFDGTHYPGVLDATALQVAEGSTLQGVGRVSANVENLASILLNTAPGSLLVEGNVTLAAGGNLQAKIGLGAAHDAAGKLEVQGALALGGTLTVTLADGYTPAVGDRFEIASAATLTGNFGTTVGLELPNGLRLRVDFADGKVALVVIQP